MPVAQAERLCPQAVFLPADMHEYVAVHHGWSSSTAASPTASRSSPSTRPFSTSPAAGASSVRRRRSPVACRNWSTRPRASPALPVSGPTSCLPSWPPVFTSRPASASWTAADVGGRLRDLAVGELVRRRAGGRSVACEPRVDHGRHAARHSVRLSRGGVRLVGARGLKQLGVRARSLAGAQRPESARSLGHETTFAQDIRRLTAVARDAAQTHRRLMAPSAREGFAAQTVAVKVRDTPSPPLSAGARWRDPVETRLAFAAAAALFDGFDLRGRRVRLVGVSVSDLCSGALPAHPRRWLERGRPRRGGRRGARQVRVHIIMWPATHLSTCARMLDFIARGRLRRRPGGTRPLPALSPAAAPHGPALRLDNVRRTDATAPTERRRAREESHG